MSATPEPFAERLLPAPRQGGFQMDGYWIWCGSAIRGEDGLYHLFASRWPRSLPFFAGYLQASEVVRAVAQRPTGPFVFQEIVLPARGPRHWDGMMTHNPTIHRLGNLFLLFYIGSTYTTVDQCYAGIRIGLATAPSVHGPWQRRSAPVLEPRPGKWDGTVVTNPAPCVLPDGRILLVYRSNTPDGLRLGAAVADGVDAPFRRLADGPVIQFPAGHHVEDPCIWHCGNHLEMLAKDWTGINGEPGAGIHAVSEDMVHWEPAPRSKAYSRRVRWDDGQETEQGHLERPQVLVEDGVPTHLYLATGDGPPGFRAMRETLMSRTWNMVIPLRPPGPPAPASPGQG